jgi:DNA-binding MarR family transcriptional regulator
MSLSCCPVSMCESPDCLQLTERESRVCVTICASEEPLTFSAIRNRLGYHQEIISRILRRLVNHGAIVKTRGKYRRASQ